MDACKREFGGLDVLVNNAGIFNMSGLEDTSEELWDSIVNINQKGVWLGMKETHRGDAQARRRLDHEHLFGGRTDGSTGSTAYHGTKGAVRLLTKAAAVQYGAGEHPRQLGPSGDHQHRRWSISCRRRCAIRIRYGRPLRREGTAEDVANLVLFLASDDSSYCTGAEFVVDGGLNAT